ncbi:tumor necrosis factor receptor superfamily member 11B [Callorhinchus milii]|uniref:tumor necrosis factor receptor superfamily member 11B n=1 Tax=Callorhinchus milii TaxID=7868 RepID=UPI001C3F5623|nr:tumor necrosis factor receptor superfamily member 11B [Callorhinchus milii]
MHLSKACLLSLASVLIVCANQAECQQTVPTYQHRDQETGQMLTCSRCPPGKHMVKHCTGQDDTLCAPCLENHYTQFWNYVKKCLYCNTFCSENQYTKQECNSTHNRVCECRDGYFLEFEFCAKHKECDPGFGVKIAGTPHMDTQCEICPDGFYSSISSTTEQCKRHTDCSALDLKLDVPGTSLYDNLCGPCQPGSSKEGLSKCEEIFFYFVSQQNLKQRQIFSIGKTLLKLPRANILERWNKGQHQQQVIDYLIEWKRKQKKRITVEMLVGVLKRSKMNSLARKVSNKFLKKMMDSVQNNEI